MADIAAVEVQVEMPRRPHEVDRFAADLEETPPRVIETEDNAALLAVQILSNKRPELRDAMRAYRKGRAEKVLAATLP